MGIPLVVCHIILFVYNNGNMATVVVDVSYDNERMSFSGSSEDDMAYAKTFWQSVQLLPTMESRLVSCDIKQRLKRAPPGTQSVNVTYGSTQDPDKLQKLLLKAKEQEKSDEMKKIQTLSQKKRESKLLLEKQINNRIQKEAISAQQKPKREDLEKFVFPSNDEDDQFDDNWENPKQVFEELDKFESKLNQDEDSD